MPSKNEQIRSTIAATRNRREGQVCRVYEVKVVKDKLSKQKRHLIDQYLREGKALLIPVSEVERRMAENPGEGLMTEEFETVEIEYSEDDILYYLVDEDDNEVGFVIEENGQEVECYYEGFDEGDYEVVEEIEEVVEEDGDAGSPEPLADAGKPPAKPEPYIPEKAEDHGYLHKLAP